MKHMGINGIKKKVKTDPRNSFHQYTNTLWFIQFYENIVTIPYLIDLNNQFFVGKNSRINSALLLNFHILHCSCLSIVSSCFISLLSNFLPSLYMSNLEQRLKPQRPSRWF